MYFFLTEQKRGDSGGQKTFKMPPPHGPIREINPHAPYFDEGETSRYFLTNCA